MSATLDLQTNVLAAVASVEDPEYPGLSIMDLGLLETVDVADDGTVNVGLIPTFSGCPALSIIATDVRAALGRVEGVIAHSVTWQRSPAWTPDRMSERARAFLSEHFTVAVQLKGTVRPACPLCGADTSETSMFGPSRCRSVHRCNGCNETVEVMRA